MGNPVPTKIWSSPLSINFFQIILQIYKYLPINEILKISTINWQWYQASQHPSIVRRTIINISKIKSIESLIQSGRYFTNLSFSYNPKDLPNSQLDLFWETFSEHIKYLCISRVKNFSVFIGILEKLRNLKEIEIDCCFKPTDLSANLKILSLSITSCYISSDSTISEQQADYFLSIVPSLKQLRNNNSNVGWNNSIVKYLENQTVSKTLKWLDLISVKNDSFLIKILKIENLNLEYFVMKNFSRENELEYLENLKMFISRQTKLTHLNVDLDLSQLASIPNLKNLKYLNVHLCYIDSEEPTSKFEKFWKLKVIK